MSNKPEGITALLYCPPEGYEKYANDPTLSLDGLVGWWAPDIKIVLHAHARVLHAQSEAIAEECLKLPVTDDDIEV